MYDFTYLQSNLFITIDVERLCPFKKRSDTLIYGLAEASIPASVTPKLH